jgi:prepilin peptidase CpaA
MQVSDVVLVGFLGSAAYCDLAARRIPNQLVLAGLAAAFVLRVPFGLESCLAGLGGFLLALALAMVFFALGAIGGGDAKLLAVVGAYVGLRGFPLALAYIVPLGAAFAVFMMARRRLLFLLFHNTFQLLAARRMVARENGVRILESEGSLAIPYAVPIALGTVVCWYVQGVRL